MFEALFMAAIIGGAAVVKFITQQLVEVLKVDKNGMKVVLSAIVSTAIAFASSALGVGMGSLFGILKIIMPDLPIPENLLNAGLEPVYYITYGIFMFLAANGWYKQQKAGIKG